MLCNQHFLSRGFLLRFVNYSWDFREHLNKFVQQKIKNLGKQVGIHVEETIYDRLPTIP